MILQEVTTDQGRFRVRLERDDDCESPLDTDAWLSHCVDGQAIHARPHGLTPNDMRGPLYSEWSHLSYKYDESLADRIFERYVRTVHGGAVQRSGLDLWYVTGERLDDMGCDRENAADILATEVTEIERWTAGDCWGFIIEREFTFDITCRETGSVTTEKRWEHVDSCWGFIGYEWAEVESLAAFKFAVQDNGGPDA